MCVCVCVCVKVKVRMECTMNDNERWISRLALFWWLGYKEMAEKVW